MGLGEKNPGLTVELMALLAGSERHGGGESTPAVLGSEDERDLEEGGERL